LPKRIRDTGNKRKKENIQKPATRKNKLRIQFRMRGTNESPPGQLFGKRVVIWITKGGVGGKSCGGEPGEPGIPLVHSEIRYASGVKKTGKRNMKRKFSRPAGPKTGGKRASRQ